MRHTPESSGKLPGIGLGVTPRSSCGLSRIDARQGYGTPSGRCDGTSGKEGARQGLRISGSSRARRNGRLPRVGKNRTRHSRAFAGIPSTLDLVQVLSLDRWDGAGCRMLLCSREHDKTLCGLMSSQFSCLREHISPWYLPDMAKRKRKNPHAQAMVAARNRKLTAAERSEIASKAARVMWARRKAAV